MKRSVIIAAIVVAFASFSASAQELKPLKSFGNDEVEYLKENFKKDNVHFKGRSFGELMCAVEAKFLSAEIYYYSDEKSFSINLYLQDLDFVTATIPEKRLVGLDVYFAENDTSKEIFKCINDLFPSEKRYGHYRVSFNKELADKLASILKDVKISMVIFKDQTTYLEYAD